MSKSDLKAAMEALQVRKPMQLPTRAPSFVPPTSGPAEGTPAGNPTQVVNPTPVEKEAPVAVSTQLENLTPVGNPTQVQAEPLINEGESAALTRRATEQDSSVVLEARAVDALERGYTRLPNSVLMQLASGDFTRNEIKLALLIARFTISFQRKLAPLSKTVLERRSGLRGAAVLEAISGLVAKGLIEKHQGDQHRPNMLGLVLPADWDTLTKSKRETEATPVGNPTQVVNPTSVEKEAPVTISTPAPVEKLTPAGVGNPTYFKDKERYQNSLSLLPEKLREYFSELKPARKRESEWEAFQELQTDYSVEDISDSLTLLQVRGIGAGDAPQPCHSPMAFLSKAMGEILPEVGKRRQKAREQAEHERRKAEAERLRQDEDFREAQEWASKEQAFQKAFPGEECQQEALSELLRKLPLRLSPQAGRIMAIQKWWDGLTTVE